MSRFESPQVAAKRAKRAAKEAEQLHKAARQSRLVLISVILLMVVSTTAYFVLYVIPHWNKVQRHERHQHGRRTNTSAPAASPLIPQTNHVGHE